MKNKKILTVTTSLFIVACLALIATPAFAQTNDQNGHWNGPMMGQPGGPRGQDNDNNNPMNQNHTPRSGISGTVTAVNGNTITVSGREGFASTTNSIIYTVDATNASIRKFVSTSTPPATTTVSSIIVGDKVSVQGTVNGTSVIATNIFDGLFGPMMGGRGDWNDKGPRANSSSTMPVLGNGQPVVAGTISAVNGSILTVTTASNTTYSIDASNVKVYQGQNTVALSNLTVGDKVVVQGTVNGSSVTASVIVDQSMMNNKVQQPQNRGEGFFSGIGHFFMHLFGF